MNRERPDGRWPTMLLVGSVLIWGLVLAVGAVGFELGLIDIRRGLVVAVCVGAFCLFWIGALRWRSGREDRFAAGQSTGVAGESAGERPSRAGLVSLLSMLVGLGLFAASVAAWPEASRLSWGLSWAALVTIGAGLVASIVALSDPRPRPRKELAWISWLIFVVTVVAAVALLGQA